MARPKYTRNNCNSSGVPWNSCTYSITSPRTRRLPVRRMTTSSAPTSPPPINAISDRPMVQRMANNRLRAISQAENSNMGFPSATEDKTRADPVQQAAQGDGQQQVQARYHDVGFEITERVA